MHNKNFQVAATSLGFELPQGRRLFRDISFTLNQSRYGLVGPNGVGKSTLARILAGEVAATSGVLRVSHTVAYLRQESARPEGTIAEYLSILWENSFVDPEVWGPLLENISLDKPLSVLSGGEWTRVSIVKTLALGTGLLILDEPTNNLDREARARIIQFVRNYRNSLLVISHDRELLEEVDCILELSNQGLSVYGGSYSVYNEARAEERLRQEQVLDRLRREKRKLEKEHHEKMAAQEKRIRRGSRIAERGGMPRILIGGLKRQAEETHGQIQSREEKRVENARAEFSSLHQRMKRETQLDLTIPKAELPEGKCIFEFKDFNFAYTSSEQFLWRENINLLMTGPRRWALSGRNGAGKTTLIELLVSQGRSPKGRVVGSLQRADIPMAILDQDYSLLDGDSTILENVLATSQRLPSDVRNELAKFQFVGDQVHQNVGSLSGGEKLKAALAKLLLATPTPLFLILDEPTNNLDMQSLTILEQALKAYQGALMVVSHDQIFLDNIGVEEVYVLQPGS